MKTTHLIMLAFCLAARANDVIYQTSFEPPAFTSGLPIRDQDRWEMYHDGEAISISTTNARTGAQCLKMDSSLLEPLGPNSATAYCFSRALLDATNQPPPPIVEITVSIRLDGPQTGTLGSPAQDIISANLLAVVPKPGGQGESLGGFFVSSAGKIFNYSRVASDSYKYSVPYTFDTYRTVTLRVDFIARQLTWLVDGVELGSGQFLSTITADRLISGYLYLNGPTDPIDTPELQYDPTRYAAYFDDYSLVSVPLTPVNTVIEFASDQFWADEFQPAARIKIIRRGFTDVPVRVALSTTNGTARADEEYQPVSTLVTFAPGETNKTVEIPLLDDFWPEPDKTFAVRLSDLPPGASSARSEATVLIRDDERPGSIDSSWGSDLGLPANTTDLYFPRILARLPDGKMIVNVDVADKDLTFVRYWRLLRLNPDGSVDSSYPVRNTFPAPQKGELFDRKATVLPDGGLLVWDFESVGDTFRGYRLRFHLNPDGTKDDRFPTLTCERYSLEPICQGDGKILVTEPSAPILLKGQKMPWLFRLNSDGSVDNTFKAATSSTGSVRLLDNGKLLVETLNAPTNLFRLNPDGSVDSSFSTSANLNWHLLALLPDDQLLVISQGTGVYRLNRDGSIDATFKKGAVGKGNYNSGIAKAKIQPDGKILLIGYFKSYNGVVRNGIVRLNADGSVDAEFKTSGFSFSRQASGFPPIPVGAENIVPMPGGQWLVPRPATFDAYNGEPVIGAILLNADGTRDPNFSASAELIPAPAPEGLLYFAAENRLVRLRTELPLRIVSNSARPGAALIANALPGRSYVLQASENLAVWRDVTTQSASTNRIEFTDPNAAAAAPKMFYRVKQD